MKNWRKLESINKLFLPTITPLRKYIGLRLQNSRECNRSLISFYGCMLYCDRVFDSYYKFANLLSLLDIHAFSSYWKNDEIGKQLFHYHFINL